MALRLFLLAILSCLVTGSSAIAGALPVVISVGTDAITIQTTAKPGLKVTDIDSSGNKTVEAPQNIVTYSVPPNAEIEVDGLPSKLADVRAGMIVDLRAGLDRATAESIVATTVPPPPPASKEKGHALHRGVYADVVIAVTPDRITYGAPGSSFAKAAYITPHTRITVNGEKMDVSAISAGMEVSVSAMDKTHADEITAGHVDNEDQ